MGQKTTKTWEHRLDRYFTAFCRKAFRWYPVRREVKYGEEKNGKISCQKCGNYFQDSEIQVDHVMPVGSLEGRDWNAYRERMFCAKDNLQRLCKKDHYSKSAKENKERRKCKKPN